MRQTWRNLYFLHWPVPIEALREHIPNSLQMIPLITMLG
ncbi:DUF2071 domain-containing protein [Cytobacillus kochii]